VKNGLNGDSHKKFELLKMLDHLRQASICGWHDRFSRSQFGIGGKLPLELK
jgi:hypothetical protein